MSKSGTRSPENKKEGKEINVKLSSKDSFFEKAENFQYLL